MTRQPDATEIAALQSQFESASPQEILQWGVDFFGPAITLVTSFQPTGIVTLHMLQSIAPKMPVITVDTGLLFPETYALTDALERLFRLCLYRAKANLSLEEQARLHGERLWKRDPDQCCTLRKVHPLNAALKGYAAWITGLRRDQSPQRAETPIISWDERHQMLKLCPFANWTHSMIWTYLQAHDLPYNALHDLSYPSIGCFPCTTPTSAEDPRAGRWANHAKTECGIHLPAND